MKHMLLPLALCGILAAGAAGEDPEDLTGGVFILHAPPGLSYSLDPPADGWCGSAWVTTCEDQVNTLSSSDVHEWVWYILSNFWESKSYDAVEYGISYDASLYMFAAAELCTPSPALTIEYPSAGAWPAAGSAIAIALTAEPYWTGTMLTSGLIHGWHYSGMDPGTITLGPSGATGFIGWLSTSGRAYSPECIGVLGLNMDGQACCSTPPLYACCFEEDRCEIMTPPECEAAGGSIRTEVTSCDPNPCLPAPQACCFGYECQELTPDDCITQGGVVYPDDCHPNPCPGQPRACCFDGSCDVLTPDECSAQGGVLYPDPDCFPNPCPPPSQACCFISLCQELTPADCAAQGGVVYPDPDCLPNPCPVTPQACCLMLGSCFVTTPANCEYVGGVVYPDPDCDPNPCPQPPPRQACCFGHTCTVQTPDDCIAHGGVIYPDPDCSPNPCPPEPQACCFDATCVVMLPADCTAEGGVSYPYPDCDPNPCPILPQECSAGSVPSGSQDELTGGVFILHAPPGLAYSLDPPGSGWFDETLWSIDCASQANSIPADDESEWVWYILSQFYESKRFQAVEYGIIYDADLYLHAASELCTPAAALTIEYPATGAWPAAGSAIAIALQGEPYWWGTLSATGMIHGWHYTYMAPGTITLGPSGATGFIGWLSGSGESYAPMCIGVLGVDRPGVPCCSEVPSEPQACCFEDGHCEVLPAYACVAGGGVAYPDPTCETVNCPQPPQACCFAHDCQLLGADDCVAQGGVVYPELTCDPNPCEAWSMACCLPDGECTDVDSEEECDAAGGLLYPTAHCASPGFECPEPPFARVCCLPTEDSCVLMHEQDCLAAGGVSYAEVDCEGFQCPIWRACCLSDHSCRLMIEVNCAGLSGVWHPECAGCEPQNPCREHPVSPVPSTWGAIKSIYR